MGAGVLPWNTTFIARAIDALEVLASYVDAPKGFSKFWIVFFLTVLIIGTLVPAVHSFRSPEA